MAVIYPFMQGLRESPFPAPGKTVTIKSFIPESGTEVGGGAQGHLLDHFDVEGLGCLQKRPPHPQHSQRLLEQGVVGQAARGLVPGEMGVTSLLVQEESTSSEEEDGARPPGMLPHHCILPKQHLSSSISLELEPPARNLPRRRLLTRRCLPSLPLGAELHTGRPAAGLPAPRSFTPPAAAHGALGRAVGAGAATGCSFSSAPAPAERHGQAAAAAQGCGRASLYLWEALRRARCPRGASRPRTAQAGAGRAFSFAFSFSCGKGGVEKRGGSAMALGKIIAVLKVPGTRPARVGVRAKSCLSSAV